MTDVTAATTSPMPEARWFSSLRVRLALTVAVAVGVTGIGANWLALLLARQALVREVKDIATRAAAQAADQVSRLATPLDVEPVSDMLRDFDAAVGEVETLTLVRELDGAARVVTTTGTPPPPSALLLGLRAMREQRPLVEETNDAIRVAAPVARPGEAPSAVIVRADLASVIGLQQRAVQAVVGFGLLAIVAIVLLVDFLTMRLVYDPIRKLHRTIALVAAGDFSARAPVERHDEIGAVAGGLNDMLSRLENFNDAMQARVREATDEVQQRNQQLVDSYHRLFGLREQLASAEQLASVGQTAANVAHQVGTPLNLISGYVQLLKEELGPASPYAPRLAIIEEQIAKVTTTVRTLLDRSRHLGRKTRTTAGELVERVVEVMLPNLSAARIAHVMELPAGDVPILVDATNLELSLLNLMTNAVDAMPGGGTLRVRVVDGPAHRVRIEISDTGHGIPDELLPRIFEPWVSTKKPGRGTGLGLAIARDVVSQHGGSISVASAVGRGTTFTIDLPSDSARDAGRAAS